MAESSDSDYEVQNALVAVGRPFRDNDFPTPSDVQALSLNRRVERNTSSVYPKRLRLLESESGVKYGVPPNFIPQGTLPPDYWDPLMDPRPGLGTPPMSLASSGELRSRVLARRREAKKKKTRSGLNYGPPPSPPLLEDRMYGSGQQITLSDYGEYPPNYPFIHPFQSPASIPLLPTPLTSGGTTEALDNSPDIPSGSEFSQPFFNREDFGLAPPPLFNLRAPWPGRNSPSPPTPWSSPAATPQVRRDFEDQTREYRDAQALEHTLSIANMVPDVVRRVRRWHPRRRRYAFPPARRTAARALGNSWRIYRERRGRLTNFIDRPYGRRYNPNYGLRRRWIDQPYERRVLRTNRFRRYYGGSQSSNRPFMRRRRSNTM